MREFLTEVLTGEQSLSTAAGHSYSKTLKAYNGWVVRGVYAVSLLKIDFSLAQLSCSAFYCICNAASNCELVEKLSS